MSSLQSPDLVIFDCDGVLIDSQIIQCQVDAAELTRVGYPITADELAQRFIGTATKEIQVHVEAVLGRTLPTDFETRRDRLVDEAYRRELKPIAGVENAMVAMGLPACVASNARMVRLRDVLNLTGLLALFDPHIFGADLVPRPKPAPDLFLFAAEQMGALPTRSLVI